MRRNTRGLVNEAYFLDLQFKNWKLYDLCIISDPANYFLGSLKSVFSVALFPDIVIYTTSENNATLKTDFTDPRK